MHGDDFLSEGPAENLTEMIFALEQTSQMKTEVIGPDHGQQLEARVLNRVIRLEEAGITWEPTSITSSTTMGFGESRHVADETRVRLAQQAFQAPGAVGPHDHQQGQ